AQAEALEARLAAVHDRVGQAVLDGWLDEGEDFAGETDGIDDGTINLRILSSAQVAADAAANSNDTAAIRDAVYNVVFGQWTGAGFDAATADARATAAADAAVAAIKADALFNAVYGADKAGWQAQGEDFADENDGLSEATVNRRAN